jgi:hypothetical protein
VAAVCAAAAVFLSANLSLPVSAAVLAIAGAAALGAFDSPSAAREPEATPKPPVTLSYTPEPSVGPLVITYYLVDTQTAMEALLLTESQLVNREWLRKNDIEVLMVVDEASEERALRAYEAAKRRSPFAQFELIDLRD